MRTRTRLATAIDRQCNSRNPPIRQVHLAAESGLSQTGIARLLSLNRRPDIDTLKKITHCWGDAHSNLEVLCAHLCDEVERAGHLQDSVNIHPTGRAHTIITDLDRDIDTLREEGRQFPDVALLLNNLASLVRHGLGGSSSALRVAETSPMYLTRPTALKGQPAKSKDRKPRQK